MTIRSSYPRLVLFFSFLLSGHAQFGGRPGDVVFYAVTANGSGDFQTVPDSSANSPQGLAAFKVTSLASVPKLTSEPFPLLRQIFYTTPTETFAIGSYPENTYGDHRVFIMPLKVLVIGGRLHTIGDIFGGPNAFIGFEPGLDIEGDVVVEEEVVAAWFPGQWPFEVPTDVRGSVGPPELSGFAYIFQTPGLNKFPFLMPWEGFSVVYPGAGWQPGIDLKTIEVDRGIGTTIRQLRLRPGTRTPEFRIPGHTHLFVLQGAATITGPGLNTYALKQDDYAFVPENFVVSLANPVLYSGPATR